MQAHTLPKGGKLAENLDTGIMVATRSDGTTTFNTDLSFETRDKNGQVIGSGQQPRD